MKVKMTHISTAGLFLAAAVLIQVPSVQASLGTDDRLAAANDASINGSSTQQDMNKANRSESNTSTEVDVSTPTDNSATTGNKTKKKDKNATGGTSNPGTTGTGTGTSVPTDNRGY